MMFLSALTGRGVITVQPWPTRLGDTGDGLKGGASGGILPWKCGDLRLVWVACITSRGVVC